MFFFREGRRSRRAPTRDPRGASAASGAIQRGSPAAVLRRSKGTSFVRGATTKTAAHGEHRR